MTTTPPAAPPAPAGQPAPRTPSSGTASLVFGILLLVIALPSAIRGTSLTLLSIVRTDPSLFGYALGTLTFAAALIVPGILLIRRSNRLRREKRAAIAAQIYELEHFDDERVQAPASGGAPSHASGLAQSQAPAPQAPPAPQGPPAPPVTQAPPVPPIAPPA